MITKMPLEEAIREIKKAYGPEMKKAGFPPFFFVVGAGISSPSIPLARGIINECEKRILDQEGKSPQPANFIDVLDEFSNRFQKAMPQSHMRQNYLRVLIEGKAISYAKFLLARILLHKQITHLVVTTNFDDLLSRALTLCGAQPRTYDQPQSIASIKHWENDIQILHVHGTYLYYNCVALRGEIKETAKLDNHNKSIVEKLGEVLGMCTPLVIGYSGWSGDVIMSALKRRLKNGSELDSYLYWFCYQESVIESLPGWLKNNPSVRFVVPEKDTTLTIRPNKATKENIFSPLEVRRRELEGFISEEAAKLDAVSVFQKLIGEFEIPEPPLIHDPLGFHLDRLKTEIDDAERHIGSTIQLIICAREMLVVSEQ